jgi:hypothetical protein
MMKYEVPKQFRTVRLLPRVVAFALIIACGFLLKNAVATLNQQEKPATFLLGDTLRLGVHYWTIKIDDCNVEMESTISHENEYLYQIRTKAPFYLKADLTFSDYRILQSYDIEISHDNKYWHFLSFPKDPKVFSVERKIVGDTEQNEIQFIKQPRPIMLIDQQLSATDQRRFLLSLPPSIPDKLRVPLLITPSDEASFNREIPNCFLALDESINNLIAELKK